LVLSLKTRRKDEAAELAAVLSFGLKGIFTMARRNSGLSESELHQIARRFFRATLQQGEMERLSKPVPVERDIFASAYWHRGFAL
jgi:hypothetical protein